MQDARMLLQTAFLNHEAHEGKDMKHTKRKAEDNDLKRMFF